MVRDRVNLYHAPVAVGDNFTNLFVVSEVRVRVRVRVRVKLCFWGNICVTVRASFKANTTLNLTLNSTVTLTLTLTLPLPYLNPLGFLSLLRPRKRD
jgi:hypothetical protein